MFRITSLILLSLMLMVSGGAWAVTEVGTGNNVLAKIEPADPRPGEFVRITLTGYGFDLNRAHFKWFKDHKEVRSGFGDKTFSFQTGPLGQETKINVFVSYNSRLMAEKSFIFEPTDLKIYWQASSSIPPFYQGKARASSGSVIKLEAEPYLVDTQGKLKNKAQLIYSWSRDNKPLNLDSGPGKNVVYLKTNPDESRIKIGLTVSTLDQKQSVSEGLILNLTRPQIVFYEEAPLVGVNYAQPITSTYELNQTEAIFQALPLFWPIQELNRLVYDWQINQVKVSSLTTNPGSLVVRRPAGASGQNEIKLELKSFPFGQLNLNEPLIQANSKFNIRFGLDSINLNSYGQ